ADFKSSYNLICDNVLLGRIDLQVMGEHNILNSLLAVATGLELNVPFSDIRKGLAEFNGVFRRFEWKGERDGVTIFDDYAHHPTEIETTLRGVRQNTDRRIIVVFQPHLYSRTRDFYREFGSSFHQSDILLVTPIYPAREQPLPGISGQMIATAATQSGHKQASYITENKDIIPVLRDTARPGDLIITMGAGNIYHFGEKFLKENP
ncbi:MAG: UDP-N-acetylmuramate--L-alanine ligase, partial [Candidatus Cloacimonetes bacterium]|nr:UDP-N-acetylmuramate--L-alanine ligase [Candidatus Cloacimonadota bacterium]